MPWQDPAELFVGKTGDVFLAPVGTPLPANASDSLDADFEAPGYLAEDGVSFSIGGEVTDFNVWQSLQPARREKTSQDITFGFSMVQWNEISIPLAFGGGDVTSLGGDEYAYAFPAADATLDERALVLDVIDGDNKHRFVFQRGNITEPVEVTFTRGSLASLPVTYSVLAPEGGGSSGSFYSTAPGLAPGS